MKMLLYMFIGVIVMFVGLTCPHFLAQLLCCPSWPTPCWIRWATRPCLPRPARRSA
jgi:hypothetical protein